MSHLSGETEVRHVGFPDPAKVTSTKEEIMAAFRQVRDALRKQLVPLLKFMTYTPDWEMISPCTDMPGWQDRS